MTSKKTSKQNTMFIITAITMSVYLLWRIFFTLPFQAGLLQLIFGCILVIGEIITTLTTFELYYRKSKKSKVFTELPVVPDSCYPDVDVLIVTHNESPELLYKTANACTFMEYPVREKVHIYFADDTNRTEVSKLAAKLGIGYIGLEGNTDAKSGNLNNALRKTSSPLVATFDADMIPRRKFLVETVPYFLLQDYIKDIEKNLWRKRKADEKDPNMKIGLIQTPQSFYNPDLFQSNLYAENKIPNEQDFFSREVNIMRNSSNSIAYTGSNTLISRQALEEIGGFPVKTITEDFETSIRIQKAGYITYSTDKVLAAGLSTTTVRAMLKQRTRWARGVIQSIQNTKAIFTSKLSFSAKVTYLNVFLYWWSFFFRIIFILAPIMFAAFDFQVVNCDFSQLLIFWLPGYFFYSYSMKTLSDNIRNQRWSHIIDTTLAPYLIFPVLLETFGIHQHKFKVTNKNNISNERYRILYSIPHMILLLLSVYALIRFVWGKYGIAIVYSSIIIFWLCNNGISILFALMFMHGRHKKQEEIMLDGEETIELHLNGRTVCAQTKSFSDSKAIFTAENDLDLKPNDRFTATIKTTDYKTSLNCVLINCKYNDKKALWYFKISVEPVDEENKRQYMQIVYDRENSLPKELDQWTTTYDHLYHNISVRLFSKRKRKNAVS